MFEIKVVDLEDFRSASDREKEMNEYSVSGWELISVDNQCYAYFQREKIWHPNPKLLSEVSTARMHH